MEWYVSIILANTGLFTMYRSNHYCYTILSVTFGRNTFKEYILFIPIHNVYGGKLWLPCTCDRHSEEGITFTVV